MSEEENEQTVFVNNPQHPSDVRLSYPFIVIDAGLSDFLNEKSKVMRFRMQWHQISSGSTSYTITTEGGGKLGELVVRAIGERETFVRAVTAGPLPDYLPWILIQFVWWIPGNLLGIRASAYHSPARPGPMPALPEKEKRGAKPERFNTEAREALARGEDRKSVFRKWARAKNYNLSDQEERTKADNAFRRMLSRKPKPNDVT